MTLDRSFEILQECCKRVQNPTLEEATILMNIINDEREKEKFIDKDCYFYSKKHKCKFTEKQLKCYNCWYKVTKEEMKEIANKTAIKNMNQDFLYRIIKI